MAVDAKLELEKFSQAIERDKSHYIDQPELLSWLFVDRLYARNERTDMNFYGFDGDTHLRKFFSWQRKSNISDYLPEDRAGPLAQTSLLRDRECLANLRLSVPDGIVETIARYNAQDYLFQRFYPVPDAQKPRVILDFGAGFGRMSNLAFGAGESITQLMIAVDAIPGPYLTQRVYYRGLGLAFCDYIDFHPDDFEFPTLAKSSQLIHLPTWRLDLVPANQVDLVCCVQVFKELPGEVLLFALKHFARILKPRGALYVRDHVQFHHPNQMPVDGLMLSMGFQPEFTPMLRDRDEIHGLPRIWRKLDASLYLGSNKHPRG